MKISSRQVRFLQEELSTLNHPTEHLILGLRQLGLTCRNISASLDISLWKVSNTLKKKWTDISMTKRMPLLKVLRRCLDSADTDIMFLEIMPNMPLWVVRERGIDRILYNGYLSDRIIKDVRDNIDNAREVEKFQTSFNKSLSELRKKLKSF
jgi:hypothetical protein